MRRRDVLAAVGGAASAGASGCLGTAGVPSGGAGSGTPACPSFDSEADLTICASEDQDGPLAVGRSGTELTGSASSSSDGNGSSSSGGNESVDTLTFAVRNQSGQPFEFNPHAWEIRRRESDGWVHVAPDAVPKPRRSLPPAGQYDWVLSLSLHPSPNAGREVQITESLRPGEHAFSISGALGDRRIECVARFSVRYE